MGRRDDVGGLERLADADGDGLLADRDVHEAGDLTRHVLLLDLLLDPADDEHLVEEREQLLAGECLFLFDSGHGGGEFMLTRDEAGSAMG